MIKGKKILLAYEAKFASCPRPKRLFKYLSDDNQVHVATRDTNKIDDVERQYFLGKFTLSPFSTKFRDIFLSIGAIGLAWLFERKKYVTDLDNLDQYDVHFRAQHRNFAFF